MVNWHLPNTYQEILIGLFGLAVLLLVIVQSDEDASLLRDVGGSHPSWAAFLDGVPLSIFAL